VLRAPTSWYRPQPTLGCRALQVLGVFYGLAVAWARGRAARLRLPVPVISVGNITLGGSGKTPLVIALAQELQRRGQRVAVLLRGYGGRCDGVLLVEAGHEAAVVGDEALEYRQQLPEAQVWVGRDRLRSGGAAIAAGATVLLLDDGLQHWRLARDLDITVLDRAHGLGNRLVFPAGPLREPVGQLGRADLLVLTGSGPAAGTTAPLPWPAAKPQVAVASWIAPPPGLAAVPLVAFCGIGLPAKFFAALEGAGLRVLEQRSFPDHHPYAPSELEGLQQRARTLHATLVTTVKDWQRLPSAWQAQVVPLPLVLDPQAVQVLTDLVLDRLAISADGFADGGADG
jgi:tetraacyldisaccharide 4'-kinase